MDDTRKPLSVLSLIVGSRVPVEDHDFTVRSMYLAGWDDPLYYILVCEGYIYGFENPCLEKGTPHNGICISPTAQCLNKTGSSDFFPLSSPSPVNKHFPPHESALLLLGHRLLESDPDPFSQ